MKGKLDFGLLTLFVCSVIGIWYFGYKYYWWIYCPSLRKTFGGPEVTTIEAHLWTYGIWVSIIAAALSLTGIGMLLIDRRQHG